MKYSANVSSVQDFMTCRFRWWCKWVKNRVPVASSPALDAGKILHRAFEEHFTKEVPLDKALARECKTYRKLLKTAHPAAVPSGIKAVEQMEDLIEAMPMWKDHFKIDEVLEVEKPFEWEDPETPFDLTWLGRPDRVVVIKNRIYHEQNRGLAAGMNFGMYTRLAKRHYHEHLYPYPLIEKYITQSKRKKPLKWGGTLFNLVRKLKYRTNVGKKNEATKTAEEMFYQQPIAYDLNSSLHKSVMMSLRYHVREMIRAQERWEMHGEIPAPNEKMNGGFSGNSDDPFFRVLIGEVKLNDNEVFKDREDLYENAGATE